MEIIKRIWGNYERNYGGNMKEIMEELWGNYEGEI
jgi:hypothetical protein